MNALLIKINHYYSLLIFVVFLFFIIFKFFLGAMIKIGRPDIAEKITIHFKKNKIKAEKERLESYYTNKEISIYELQNIAENIEDINSKLKKDNFSIKIRLNSSFKNLMQCVFYLEKISNKPDYYKIIKVEILNGSNYI